MIVTRGPALRVFGGSDVALAGLIGSFCGSVPEGLLVS
jgi:hypothetical protein